MICKVLCLAVLFRFQHCVLSLGTGLPWLSETLHLCTPLKHTQDIQNLKDWISETWINLAVVDYPYESNFLQPLPAWPVKVRGKCPLITSNSFHLCVRAHSLTFSILVKAVFFLSLYILLCRMG